MISNGFQSFPAIYIFWPKGKPRDLRPFKLFEMTVIQISPLKKTVLRFRIQCSGLRVEGTGYRVYIGAGV